MRFDLNYPHPEDSPWWYRLILSIWIMSITIAATFSLVLAIWFLSEHGTYTTKEAEEISFAFEILSYGVTLGIALATVQVLGPNWIQEKATWVRSHCTRKLRGVLP